MRPYVEMKEENFHGLAGGFKFPLNYYCDFWAHAPLKVAEL